MEKEKITRGPVLLRKNMTAGHYSAAGGGRLLYIQNDNLYAQKLNLRRWALEGEPEQVAAGVYSNVTGRSASFSISRNGVVAWMAGRAGLAQLTRFDRTGKVLGTAGPTGFADVRLSPDEKHVLMYAVADRAGFGVVEPDRSGYVLLPGLTQNPVWMPDSSHMLHARMEEGEFRVLERATAGGEERELARVPELATLDDVSPDGKVLFTRRGHRFIPFDWTARLPPRSRSWWRKPCKPGFPRMAAGSSIQRTTAAENGSCTRGPTLWRGSPSSLAPGESIPCGAATAMRSCTATT